jgi:superfamily II DNA or RNA helicase
MHLFAPIKPVMTLRPYQEEAIDAVFQSFKEYQRSLLVAPTGSGKTIMFAAIAKRHLPLKTLILAHREELIDQAIDKIFTSTGIEAGKEKADSYASADDQVVVGSVQTLMGEKRRSRWARDHFGLVVVDEAHHALADSYTKTLEYFNGAKLLGVTATPDRGDKQELSKLFQTLAHEISLLDLIRQKYLSRIKIQTIPIKLDIRGVHVVKGDYDANELDESLARYMVEIAHAIKKHAAFRKVLVFLPLIKTSQAFVQICKGLGMAAEHVDGASPDRKEILQRFADNKIDLLSNAMLLTEGYDCPDCDCIVVLRPTKIRSLYSQMVGRGTRIAKGKDDLLILDFIWMHERHDLMKPANLIAKTDRVANKIEEIQADGKERELEEVEQLAIGRIEDEIEAEQDAKKQREDKLKESLKDNSQRRGRTIDAIEFFTSLHEIENAEYVPEFAWERQPASEKQLMAISKFGLNAGSITCKGHASRILDRLFTRSKAKLATPKQMLWLRKHGHPAPDTATFEEAKVFLDTKFKRPVSSAIWS